LIMSRIVVLFFVRSGFWPGLARPKRPGQGLVFVLLSSTGMMGGNGKFDFRMSI